MNSENAIEVHHVSKSFKIYKDKGNMLRQKLLSRNRNRYTRREVLHDISFDIRKGETVGLIGSNGCGKSTTLKMLTKILYPNAGSIETAGKMYSMIELGAGFHPDMTGRENIYINASIYGFTRKEVDQRMDEIIRFSELEKFIDSPLRTYSSGMYLRLAFSVAINVDADILLVDEILAVGDQNFQEKCLKKLKSLQEKGVTIVLVSHNMAQVETFCSRVIWLKDGSIREDGPSREVCAHYKEETVRTARERQLQEMGEKGSQAGGFVNAQNVIPQCDPGVTQGGARDIIFTDIRLMNEKDELCRKFAVGDPVKIRACIHVARGKHPAERGARQEEKVQQEERVQQEEKVRQEERGRQEVRIQQEERVRQEEIVQPEEKVRKEEEVRQKAASAAEGLQIGNVTIEMIRKDWLLCYGLSSIPLSPEGVEADQNGNAVVEAVIDHISLRPDSYHLNLCVYDQHYEVQNFYNGCITFEIVGRSEESDGELVRDGYGQDEIGVVSMQHKWKFINQADEQR